MSAAVMSVRARLRGLSLAQRAALGLLMLLAVFAVAGPWVWPDPVAQDLSRFLEPPSLSEPLGRDHLGRSVAGRLASATRLSLLIAVACVTTAIVAGMLAGILAAWRGGLVDTVLHGLSEAFVALPALLIVLMVSAMSGGELWTLYAGIALAQWIEYFRVVRARSALLLSGPAVEAATLLRLGPMHVLRRHLWPDLRPLLTTMATFGIGTAVLAVSTLGFVGVGVAPPTPELGQMITEAFPFYHEAPWMSVAPALVLVVVLVGLLGLRTKESAS
ncbi:ABC dipeptide/oligopeptide/nickel transporter permease component [Micromonospora sp. ATCC 39149]|uniref:ABC transporter permease n=1 Tax=Micromonospora carbonacea TaxID=47853 RepID=A0A7D6GA24_9ACTN|nr:ABC transporter permease [Micromonospora sp. ATCC 39149]EEP74950.1 ABC dipeptide/oligopeptide/nickel transporter permease component [Micromonospora sp. ATCC 39149]QLK00703.1 ABC transporter permease [Micromonospora carbonacea]